MGQRLIQEIEVAAEVGSSHPSLARVKQAIAGLRVYRGRRIGTVTLRDELFVVRQADGRVRRGVMERLGQLAQSAIGQAASPHGTALDAAANRVVSRAQTSNLYQQLRVFRTDLPLLRQRVDRLNANHRQVTRQLAAVQRWVEAGCPRKKHAFCNWKRAGEPIKALREQTQAGLAGTEDGDAQVLRQLPRAVRRTARGWLNRQIVLLKDEAAEMRDRLKPAKARGTLTPKNLEDWANLKAAIAGSSRTVFLTKRCPIQSVARTLQCLKRQAGRPYLASAERVYYAFGQQLQRKQAEILRKKREKARRAAIGHGDGAVVSPPSSSFLGSLSSGEKTGGLLILAAVICLGAAAVSTRRRSSRR